MAAEVVTLADESVGSRARILPSFGFNCFEFAAHVGGRSIDVLWSAPNFAGGHERASGSGIPLLFPFPGRIRGTTLHWEGRDYVLKTGDARGNAIHGFVLTRPWRVLEQSGSRVVGQFQAGVDDPPLLEQWPADYRITATYELRGNMLSSKFVLENPDSKPLPCGFGTHPYFRLPLGGSTSDHCLVKLPVSRHWELIEMLPTGKCDDLNEAAKYQRGLEFSGMKFDDVFGGLIFDGNKCVSEIVDPGSRVKMRMEFNRAFRECVVYTPPHREAICIEPYTCVPGAFDQPTKFGEMGLQILQPGESFTAEVVMSVS